MRLVVECPEPQCPQGRLYDQPVPAPAGASLLDVLRAAAAREPHDFTYVALPAGAGGPSGVPACHTWGGQVSCTRATGSPVLAVPWWEPHRAVPASRFDTQDTPQGPFLSSVQGLEAQQRRRSYWQLLSGPSTSLQMGE